MKLAVYVGIVLLLAACSSSGDKKFGTVKLGPDTEVKVTAGKSEKSPGEEVGDRYNNRQDNMLKDQSVGVAGSLKF